MKKVINIVGMRVRVIDAAPVEATDAVSVALPSLENTLETIKGAGILGEVEVPTSGFLGPLDLSISAKSMAGLTALLVPGSHKIEVIWVRDVLDTAGAKIGISQNKVIASGFLKKYDESSVELGAGQDVTVDMTCNTYSRYTDGKPVVEIDKFNGVYKYDGKDVMGPVTAALR